jgi:prevent-host-death family protein
VRFVTLRDLKINPSRVLDELKHEDFVVTRNGRPAAALIHLDEETLDDFVIAHHPRLWKEVAEARREYQLKGGASYEEMRERVDRRSE